MNDLLISFFRTVMDLWGSFGAILVNNWVTITFFGITGLIIWYIADPTDGTTFAEYAPFIVFFSLCPPLMLFAFPLIAVAVIWDSVDRIKKQVQNKRRYKNIGHLL